jgi:L-arabinokinase
MRRIFVVAVVSELISHLKNDPESILKDGHQEVYIASAPGRLDVMGGAIEFSGGLACQMPLEAGTAVALQRRDDRQLVIKTYNAAGGSAGENVVTLSIDDFYGTASLLPQEMLQKIFTGSKHWAAHVAGAFPTLGKHKKITRRTHGANIACYSTLPLGAGAASSAALECATLWAITAAYHLILDPLEIALLAQKIENHIVGMPAGVLEPAVCVLGRKDQLLLMECQPHEIKGFAGVPKGYFFAGVSLDERGDMLGRRFEKDRAEVLMAQAIIARFYADTGVKKDPTRGYLANITQESYGRYFQHILPGEMTGEKFIKEFGPLTDRNTVVEPGERYSPRDAAELHIAENGRTHAFVSRLRAMVDSAGSSEEAEHAKAAGKIMAESGGGILQQGARGGAEAESPVPGVLGSRVSAAGDMLVIWAAESARAPLEAVYGARLLRNSAPGAGEAAPLRISLSELTRP